jgi:hypothetical protein
MYQYYICKIAKWLYHLLICIAVKFVVFYEITGFDKVQFLHITSCICKFLYYSPKYFNLRSILNRI